MLVSYLLSFNQQTTKYTAHSAYLLNSPITIMHSICQAILLCSVKAPLNWGKVTGKWALSVV